ncbi:LISK family protein kinase [Heterostelium album PN500]|uniref:non-specific serine/threonine protein kinase n=1 Tax=Heterostelium pallidum (strain ATCC 26659 / Pp 5 / PN500) TaxID=670386 RepID=D3B867_HETP5|nr:LISK family protein kinase [Heterostelium album PN500]EFA82235.1 LISK family protein kinase [Heterostelium album PN500]|eukprot:XP_020434352.1 LISK family protein kinase [Heterostelium album PN500]
MIEEDEGLIESEETTDIDVKVLKIAEQIGAGSYGMVYRGSYFNSQVAIKKIRPGEHNRDLQKYLKREIAVLKNIQHPNIVQFIGVYYENENVLPAMISNQTWIVTEFVPGGNLHEKIKDSAKQFPLSLRFKLSLDIALAMAYLHSRNILFRDLKSKNILIDDTSSPIRGKVCDFGFARIVKNKNRHLSICGTDDFMAPEVILGMDYDESADIFSFGVVMLEMATRKKISKYIERGPQNAFEISEDLARELIPESIPGLYTELIIDCIKYTPTERPVFSHIIHVLKQLVSLFPIPQSIENPLSPHSSPIIPRKNSKAVNLPPLEGLLRKSIELKIGEVGLTSSGSSISSTSSSNKSGDSNGSNSQNCENNNCNNSQSNNNNHNEACSNSQTNSEANGTNDNHSSIPEESENHVAIGGDDELDLDEEEKESKVRYLKERMLLVLADLNKYMDVQCQELLSISQEDQIADKYDECRKVIELRKVLCEVVGDDVPPTTPKKTTPPTTRVGIFLKSMDKSLQEIFVSIELLKIRVEREKQLLESIYLARAVSKLKRIYESKLILD